MDTGWARAVESPAGRPSLRRRVALWLAAGSAGAPFRLPGGAALMLMAREEAGAGAVLKRKRLLRSMELRWDMELLGRSVSPHHARDMGVRPGEAPAPVDAQESLSSRERSSEETNRHDIKQSKEVGMAPEMTPRVWPSENRGLADSAAGLAGIGTLFERLAIRLAARFAPWGRVSAKLSTGQTVVLDGSRMARVDCLDGRVWVTCPSDGRDLRLVAGGAVTFPGPGMVAVTAVDGPARVRLGWR